MAIITGTDRLTLNDGTIKRTGFWAQEFVPHERFRAAGTVVEVATPGGVQLPLDQKSWRPR